MSASVPQIISAAGSLISPVAILTAAVLSAWLTRLWNSARDRRRDNQDSQSFPHYSQQYHPQYLPQYNLQPPQHYSQYYRPSSLQYASQYY
ncbi:hypothetical protein F4810DRAFT_669234 [Camillea tinctor]|nr:hypothetical protein F4810DRAFT_669234 [Camillea tinctor]